MTLIIQPQIEFQAKEVFVFQQIHYSWIHNNFKCLGFGRKGEHKVEEYTEGKKPTPAQFNVFIFSE